MLKNALDADMPARCVLFLFLTLPLRAQNAELFGSIRDPADDPVAGARVQLKSASTGSERDVRTNERGAFSVTALPPGSYDLLVSATGFEHIRQTGIHFEVGQRVRLDFTLTISKGSETVIVRGRPSLLNNSDASVSTVISRTFVENLPLNGRSFTSLINLTPGVVLTPSTFSDQGQFSVNGQRADANYFMVDGVSVNLGNAGSGSVPGQGGAGQLPVTSAFGGGSNLVSLDALEEFRIRTSTFAPEYGRMPGAQISVLTRSGTNKLHGTMFDYLRNDALDAKDWFANRNSLKKPELRQNDFGGVLGGPIEKDKLFFFGSYEGLRVLQPRTAQTYVPSLTLRDSVAPQLRPILRAFPQPNGPELGNGSAGFAASFSDPSRLDSTGIRVDYLRSYRLTVFGRFSYAPSELEQRGGSSTNYSDVFETEYRTQMATVGVNQAITPQLTHEFRFNYARSLGRSALMLDNFGGAVRPSSSDLFPDFTPPGDAIVHFIGDLVPNGLRLGSGRLGDNRQNQINVTDSVSSFLGTHQVKIGIDYRRLAPRSAISPYTLQYIFGSSAAIAANSVAQAFVVSRTPVSMLFSNSSIFAQDAWQARRRLTLTYGVRWEYNAAPTGAGEMGPRTVTGLNDLATMKLAPAGTPLWTPEKYNFAPRLGLAFTPGANTVVRAGAGVFYDLGYGSIANWAVAFPYAQQKIITGTMFPLSAALAAPPAFSASPPVTYLVVMDPRHSLPRTYQWNVAVEQKTGDSIVFTLGYVGAVGRDLLRQVYLSNPNPDFTGEFDIIRNEAESSYHALQTQFRKQVTHGFQALLSYSWSHSIDNSSSDSAVAMVRSDRSPLTLERGSSDFDVRHSFSGALSLDLPRMRHGVGRLKRLMENWSVDCLSFVRSATPVNVVTGLAPFGGPSGLNGSFRPDAVPGVALYLSDPNVGGGKRINRAAFVAPMSPRQGTLGRNALRGFGTAQVDLAVRRQFSITEGIRLQARGDFFNVSNHPSFGNPVNFMSSPLFGQATQSLAPSLGSGGASGGLNPLYQAGGARSVQLALKVQF